MRSKKPLSELRRATLDFINRNLEDEANIIIAKKLNKRADSVSKVRRGVFHSKPILHELETMAIENKRKALAMMEYNRKSVTL